MSVHVGPSKDISGNLPLSSFSLFVIPPIFLILDLCGFFFFFKYIRLVCFLIARTCQSKVLHIQLQVILAGKLVKNKSTGEGAPAPGSGFLVVAAQFLQPRASSPHFLNSGKIYNIKYIILSISKYKFSGTKYIHIVVPPPPPPISRAFPSCKTKTPLTPHSPSPSF